MYGWSLTLIVKALSPRRAAGGDGDELTDREYTEQRTVPAVLC